MLRRELSLLIFLLILQVGCVEVRTYAKANGYVVKELVIRTNRYYEGSLRERVKNTLDGWSIWRSRRGDVVEIHIRRKFNPKQLGTPLPGMKVEYERELKWFPPIGHYRYSETFDFSRFAKAVNLLEPELGALSKVTLTVVITMPSNVLPEKSNSKDVRGNVAKWVIDNLGEPSGQQRFEFEVTARGVRKILLSLYILVALILLIGGYIFYPRIAERLKDTAETIRMRMLTMRLRRQRRKLE
ncbi:MAG: hypothetical protein RMK18_02495 [Armatimonadota bacterium]|nr:hypothetical protein [Armatimonadota bacterium]MCX7777598.1 hypothetical protein [Armatimonadota bacterium]MDW8024724.1 hypothetical protein [Armatimonadota bacterium]